MANRPTFPLTVQHEGHVVYTLPPRKRHQKTRPIFFHKRRIQEGEAESILLRVLKPHTGNSDLSDQYLNYAAFAMLKAITLYDQTLAIKEEKAEDIFVLHSFSLTHDHVTEKAKSRVFRHLSRDLTHTHEDETDEDETDEDETEGYEIKENQAKEAQVEKKRRTQTVTMEEHLMEANNAGTSDFTLESLSALHDRIERLEFEEKDLLLQWTLNHSVAQLTSVLTQR